MLTERSSDPAPARGVLRPVGHREEDEALAQRGDHADTGRGPGHGSRAQDHGGHRRRELKRIIRDCYSDMSCVHTILDTLYNNKVYPLEGLK